MIRFSLPFVLGRGRPSMRALLGGLKAQLMDTGQALQRIEAQNGRIVETLGTILETQKTQGEALKALSGGGTLDAATAAALDASIADTDAKLAGLGAPAGTAANQDLPAEGAAGATGPAAA